MKKQSWKKTLSIVILLAMVLTTFAGCGIAVKDSIATAQVDEENKKIVFDDGTKSVTNLDNQSQMVADIESQLDPNLIVNKRENKLQDTLEPCGEINEGVLLVKAEDFSADKLEGVAYSEVSEIFVGSMWHKIVLEDQGRENTIECRKTLLNASVFDEVEYDYIMSSDGEVASIEVSGNPYSQEQGYIDLQGIFSGWEKSKSINEASIGGTSDTIVAIIDTGVDYNHLDLDDNIWYNTAEIPNNGIDDDGNGYVDDYYGWNFVNGTNDPMDDNGHGTHVAGIVAAENNLNGIVGVAFNCKIMVLKAGNSSGYFNNSDVAAAIQYAYMNGASVINMSFGGIGGSTMLRDALENAYNQCVLVASSGNDGSCIEFGACVYPAAYSFVIGVGSCDKTGLVESVFGNCDLTLHNSAEYETFACGENVFSTWPNNKIACMSGTSMAAPIVSGIAAILRSTYKDRNVYPNKYIQSQIVNTGDIHPVCKIGGAPHERTVANLYNALNRSPKPQVELYDSYIFDAESFSEKNKQDSIISAGETIHIGFDLYNYGGVASNVKVKINVNRNHDEALVDPYIEIIKGEITMDDIGTYSLRNGNRIYDESGNVVDMENSFIVKIADDIPNDYTVDFNFIFEYENGLDSKDTKVYQSTGKVTYTTYNATILSGVISEDMTFTSDRLYIIPDELVIAKGAKVVFTEGCKIEFYMNEPGYVDTLYNPPSIQCFGELEFNGSKDNMITIKSSEAYLAYMYEIRTGDPDGCIVFNYCNIYNNSTHSNNRMMPNSGNLHFNNCYLANYSVEDNYAYHTYSIESGNQIEYPSWCSWREINGCIIDGRYGMSTIELSDSLINSTLVFGHGLHIDIRGKQLDGVDGFGSKALKYITADGEITYSLSDYAKEYGVHCDNNVFLCTMPEWDAEHLPGSWLPHSPDNSITMYSGNTFYIADTLVDREIYKDYFEYNGWEAGDYLGYGDSRFYDFQTFRNNIFLTGYEVRELSHLINVGFGDYVSFRKDTYYEFLSEGNIWQSDIQKYASVKIANYYNADGTPIMNVCDLENHDDSLLPAYIKNIEFYDSDSHKVSTLTSGDYTARVTFSKDVAEGNEDFALYYGSVYPYKDFVINGSFVSGNVWEGQFSVKSFIEGGVQHFSLKNHEVSSVWSENNIVDNSGSFSFDITLNSALSMNLFATPTADGIDVSWLQDDYDTLMGYNIYRSDEKDGNYVKINRSVISADEDSFLDDNVEPGKTYWYTFTVVMTDMSESTPASKVMATAFDTIKPAIYHTPVNQGYLNNNLTIYCTATDNVAVSAVTLYYRTTGEATYQMLTMSKQNDRYSATIFGSELSLDGLEYYIVVSDGINEISKGGATDPYKVIVKDASAISRVGDVDGDGVVTTKDALMIMQAINGDLLLTDDQFKRADLNKDSVLSSVEALRILQYINGNVTSLEM